SSATVYGIPDHMPLDETMPTSCTNPYGWTKYMNEQILTDIARANPDWSVVLLRYFNPIGAHESGRIGEMPNGIPNNLMPFITQVASGKREFLSVFGSDYPTPDGTGVRDYIHVVDLARAHVAALQAIEQKKGVAIYNIGTGHGYSVLDVVNAFMKANGVNVPYSIKPRRPGDIATCYCDPAKAKAELGWEAQYGIEDMCRDSWNWQKNNPNGFEE
ncbi:MAG: UDP-glucose 4-epimerase GalE, partial [Bacteroidaceae bacterium]|nr:UDP-glucose 4-epimerase GalE [Bacteroidaceae bacterium]